MRLHIGLLTFAGLAAMSSAGCMGPMFGPYANSGMPGYSTYPGNGGYPGAYGGYNGVPGNYPAYPSGNFIAPGTNSFPSSIPSSIPSNGSGEPTPTFAPSNGGNAAPYGSGVDRPVPDPTSPYFPQPNEQFFPPGGTTMAPPPAGSPMPDRNANSEFPEPVRDSTSDTIYDDTRTASITPRRRPTTPGIAAPGAIQPVSMAEPATATTGSDRYAVAPDFTWMEGTVAYDQSDRSWNIVYDLTPDADDEYSGHFALSKNPVLQVLRDGEAVRLEGRIDPVEKDPFGKPTYLVTRIIQTRNQR